MTTDAEQPLDRLKNRVDRFQLHGDARAVLDPAALADADAAWQARFTDRGPNGAKAVDPYTVYLLGLFHWCRHLALGQDGDDLRKALKVFALVVEVMPQAVPRAARDLLGVPAEDPQGLLTEVRRRVDLYRNHGDPSGLTDTQGPELVRRLQLAAETAGGTPFPAAQAVALFHWYRHLVVSDEADIEVDLSEAMRFFTWVDTVHPGELPEEVWPLSRVDPAVARAAHRAMASVQWVSDLRTADRAIALLRQAADGLPPDHVSRGVMMAKLGVALQLRFAHSGDATDLDRAVDWGRRGHAALPKDHPNRARYTSNLANALLMRCQMADAPEAADIEAAVALAEDAVRGLPHGHENRATRVANLAAALGLRFEHGSDPADLDRAITLGREALSAQSHPEPHAVLNNLALLLRLRFKLRGNAADLEEASRRAAQAVAGSKASAPQWLPEFQAELASILWLTYERSKDLADLDAALDAARGAAIGTPAKHPRHADRVVMVWIVASERYRRTGAQEDLDAAIEAGRVAVPLTDRVGTGTGDVRRVDLLHQFAVQLAGRFDSTSDLDSLDEAITTLRTALAEERRPDILVSLSMDLRSRARLVGTRADWDEAVGLGRAAVEAAPDGHPERVRCLSQLCATLRERHEAYGEPADLEKAVEVGLVAVESVDLSSSPDQRYGTALSHLAAALMLRHQRTGHPGDLDDAISRGRLALEQGDPEDSHWYAAAMVNLAGALGTRYARRGAATDLDEAIALGQRAADLTPAASPLRGGRLNTLSLAMRARYERTRNPDDLDRAVETAQAAVDATPPGHAQTSAHLSGLAHALSARFQRDNHRTDADRSVEVASAAVDATWPGHPQRPGLLNNLGVFRVTRADGEDRAAAEADLREAIGHYREGLGLVAEDSPDRFNLLLNLGNALRRRYELTGHRADAVDAIANWRQVAGHPAAAAWPRLAAARQWGEIAARLGDEPGSALDGYATAVAQLPLLAWHGLGRSDRERLLTQARGLAADSAAAALAAGRPDRALELLEQSRGVIWSQILDVRTDLSKLRARDSQLAEELDRVRNELDRPDASLLAEPVPVPADHRMRLADRWDTLVEQVRSLTGFESFLKPLLASDLCEAVGDGPVVVVNVSRLRCDALIVTAGGVRGVPLPGLNADEVAGRVDAYLSVLVGFARSRRGLAEHVALESAVDEVLRWLWDTIAARVLDALGPFSTSEVRPRVWWYPTGPLTLLPLHAAGHHQERAGRTVLDRVVSSYAPTLKVLSRSRTEPRTDAAAEASAGYQRLLLVAMADTPGMHSLPNVHAERATLTSLLPGRCTELSGSRATRRTVGDALPEHAWVHFSCHGGQDLADPSQGGVHLYDGMLTVEELTSARHAHGEMAFLSACQTALGGLANLDEAITLTSALQHAGWRHVVGTLWSVWDAAAAGITDATYRHLVRDGRVDADDAARALHRATLAMRDDLPQRPSVWAPFVHVGP